MHIGSVRPNFNRQRRPRSLGPGLPRLDSVLLGDRSAPAALDTKLADSALEMVVGALIRGVPLAAVRRHDRAVKKNLFLSFTRDSSGQSEPGVNFISLPNHSNNRYAFGGSPTRAELTRGGRR